MNKLVTKLVAKLAVGLVAFAAVSAFASDYTPLLSRTYSGSYQTKYHPDSGSVSNVAGVTSIQNNFGETYNRKWRVFIPPGTKSLQMTEMMRASPPETKVIVRFGSPPTGTNVNSEAASIDTSTVLSRVTANGGGAELSMTSPAAAGGIKISSSPKQPMRTTVGGWLYVKTLQSPGDRIFELSAHMDVDAVCYRSWFANAKWDADGNPAEGVAHTCSSSPVDPTESQFISVHQWPNQGRVGWQNQFSPSTVAAAGAYSWRAPTQETFLKEVKIYFPAGAVVGGVHGFFPQSIKYAIVTRIGAPPQRSSQMTTSEYEHWRTYGTGGLQTPMQQMLEGKEVITVHTGGGRVDLAGVSYEGPTKRLETGFWVYVRVLEVEGQSQYPIDTLRSVVDIDLPTYSKWYDGAHFGADGDPTGNTDATPKPDPTPANLVTLPCCLYKVDGSGVLIEPADGKFADTFPVSTTIEQTMADGSLSLAIPFMVRPEDIGVPVDVYMSLRLPGATVAQDRWILAEYVEGLVVQKSKYLRLPLVGIKKADTVALKVQMYLAYVSPDTTTKLSITTSSGGLIWAAK